MAGTRKSSKAMKTTKAKSSQKKLSAAELDAVAGGAQARHLAKEYQQLSPEQQKQLRRAR